VRSVGKVFGMEAQISLPRDEFAAFWHTIRDGHGSIQIRWNNVNNEVIEFLATGSERIAPNPRSRRDLLIRYGGSSLRIPVTNGCVHALTLAPGCRSGIQAVTYQPIDELMGGAAVVAAGGRPLISDGGRGPSAATAGPSRPLASLASPVRYGRPDSSVWRLTSWYHTPNSTTSTDSPLGSG
jgi:hypothetical protein